MKDFILMGITLTFIASLLFYNLGHLFLNAEEHNSLTNILFIVLIALIIILIRIKNNEKKKEKE